MTDRLRFESPRAGTRSSGFTLIEIMAVVVIMALMGTLVGVAVFNQVSSSRRSVVRNQIKRLESVLELYRLDNARYPTTEQGLEALVRRPSTEPVPREYPVGGYLTDSRIPLDPWNSPYEYRSPGEHNAHSFDIWSLGADGQPGGSDDDADIGNWEDEERS